MNVKRSSLEAFVFAVELLACHRVPGHVVIFSANDGMADLAEFRLPADHK